MTQNNSVQPPDQLAPPTPSTADGSRNAGLTPAPAESHGEPENAVPPPGQEPDSVVSRLQRLGIPDSLPEQWCPKCQATVKPEGKGQCPRCKRVLKNSFLARRHPVNKLRRQQLLDQFTLDYQPNTQLLKSTCESLAGVIEQLEVLKPGSTEYQRLVQAAQTLGATLEASRHEAQTDQHITLDELEAKVKRVDRLIALVRESKAIPDPPRTECVGAVATPAPAPETEPEPCPYCHQTPTRCAELKTTRLELWHDFHYSDPEEVRRRDKEATDEMFESLRRQGPANY